MIGFGPALFLLFLTLKLLGIVGWSWVWVTAPLWIPAILVGLVWGFIGVCLMLAARQTGRR
jgi:hypothetical protein